MTPRLKVLTGIICIAALSRLLPHIPNFTPVVSMALFGGMLFSDRRVAFAVPVIAMLLSDALLTIFPIWGGFYEGFWVTYLAFIGVVAIGMLIRNNITIGRTFAAVGASSVLFFVITNFQAWIYSAFYPKTMAGLLACYEAAIPFFTYSIAGNLVYSALLLGSFAIIRHKLPSLGIQQLAPTS